MRNAAPNPEALVTRLLLLPDGTVLADNLTPSMAELLHHLNLHADPGTQCSLGCKPDPRNSMRHGLAISGRVNLSGSTGADTPRTSQEAP